MKKALLLVIVMFSVVYSSEAQDSINHSSTWYYRTCGVTDIGNWTPDEFECMWKNASRCVVRGVITTGIGITCVVAGLEIWYNYGTIGGPSPSLTIANLGLFAIVPIGITIWITGAVRKSKLKKTPHSRGINSQSVNIAPTINRNQFNNTYSLGLTASLSF